MKYHISPSVRCWFFDPSPVGRKAEGEKERERERENEEESARERERKERERERERDTSPSPLSKIPIHPSTPLLPCSPRHALIYLKRRKRETRDISSREKRKRERERERHTLIYFKG